MVSFATVEDLHAWPGGADLANPEALLRSATARIGSLTLTAVYDVDATGVPTAQSVREALRDATCAQAVFFAEIGGSSGAEQQYQSMSLGSASLTRAGAGTGRAADTATSRTSPEAVDILRAAGLLGQAAQSW